MYHCKISFITSTGNLGCGGGNAVLAYKYIIKNRGIDTEESYPYTSGNGQVSFCISFNVTLGEAKLLPIPVHVQHCHNATL